MTPPHAQTLEYIWIDGGRPTRSIRAKTKVARERPTSVSQLPDWNFDGSSTYQAEGSDSDMILRPVRMVRDPLRRSGHLVLCEVFHPDGRPHESNKRAEMRQALDAGAAAQEPWFGFEQEYTLFRNGRPLGWPDTPNTYPKPQGPFYCGVGDDEVVGRRLVEEHLQACLECDLMIYGVNAEVMLAQWEFQVGPRDATDAADPLKVTDHLWLARYLLYRLGEKHGIHARLDVKPVRGDWNGAGCHTNFSTRAMRTPGEGRAAIDQAIDRLAQRHDEHIAVYGAYLHERLTGHHETCAIDEFKAGEANRGASIRIPRSVASTGAGYLEDRRPGANCDPYEVAAALLKTVCL